MGASEFCFVVGHVYGYTGSSRVQHQDLMYLIGTCLGHSLRQRNSKRHLADCDYLGVGSFGSHLQKRWDLRGVFGFMLGCLYWVID